MRSAYLIKQICLITHRTRTTNVLIAGDLNASRPYVYDWDKCPLRDEKKYEWYIKDHVDTTATGTMAAYDRIIGYGKNLPRVVEPDSGRAFRYDEESSFCGMFYLCITIPKLNYVTALHFFILYLISILLVIISRKREHHSNRNIGSLPGGNNFQVKNASFSAILYQR